MDKKLLNYKGDKPLIKEFNNNIQRGLYNREYNNLRVVEKIVYRVTEDTNGYNRTQFVLPKQVVKEVIQPPRQAFHARRGRVIAKS
jgi:hypothetical protein